MHYERASISGKNFAPIALQDALQALHEVMTSGINIVPKPFVSQSSRMSRRVEMMRRFSKMTYGISLLIA
ncbi:hypothetical protein PKHYL_15280 [Psychrobacter sp. KH172YL61]|uniref:hypothetical protein n=1 Tax=Psychrobacter sp. KH172YL61 TaxID=2517899 RepID=UPI0010B7D51B|nr:hypothetical protein [Psychrobacter sp. KH172YL61]BBI67337.1 hypothetical protein PKHYL_15280 [Psychrobacter sp. KH172YL61]